MLRFILHRCVWSGCSRGSAHCAKLGSNICGAGGHGGPSTSSLACSGGRCDAMASARTRATAHVLAHSPSLLSPSRRLIRPLLILPGARDAAEPHRVSRDSRWPAAAAVAARDSADTPPSVVAEEGLGRACGRPHRSLCARTCIFQSVYAKKRYFRGPGHVQPRFYRPPGSLDTSSTAHSYTTRARVTVTKGAGCAPAIKPAPW